ncbi:hypothetical protein ACJIZ3_023771 [Penstemon smallii]|uniref:Uncharacterized protein n=1 Tax=Penstemon smallii TaxID=265156 RepID=A0ABD3TQ60_9LAMI
MSKSKPRRIDPTLDRMFEAIMSSRAKKIMENVRRGAGTSSSTPALRSQLSQNSSGGSNNSSRALVTPTANTTHPTRSITDPPTHDQHRSPIRSQRGSRSRENELSNPEAIRSNKRPREEGEIVARRPGKEPVLEVSSDEDIESVMNSDHPRAGGLTVDTSVFKSTIFKKEHTKLGKKHLKQNLKKASCDLLSINFLVNNVLYQGYVLAERAFKDLDKSKKKLKEQFTLVRTCSATSKEAEKKRKDVEDELKKKEDQIVDIIGQLSARIKEVEELKKTNEELVERMKLESRESYEKGRAEGLLMTSQPTREQKLTIAREFFRSPVCDAFSDMKVGLELYGVFDKAWKQCRKLGFLNERFDENALDPLKNDDCEPFPVTENDEAGPVLEQDEFYPIYLEANDSGMSDGVDEHPVVEPNQSQVEQVAVGSNQAQVEQHQVLTQEQIDNLFAQGATGGDNLNVDGFDHIDVTNLDGDGAQTHE